MPPTRPTLFIVLGLTFALGAIAGCGDPSSASKSTSAAGPTSAPAATGPTAVTEAVDPNCHMTIQVTPSTPRAVVGGQTFYFCSDDCRDAFLHSQARTASPATRP